MTCDPWTTCQALRNDMIVVRDPADIPKDGRKQAILILNRYDEIVKTKPGLLRNVPAISRLDSQALSL